MSRVLSVITIFLPFLLFSSPPKVDDFNKGMQLAQLYNRPLILVFTGLDWCPWSKKISEELFASPEFSAAIGNAFIFVHLDYPHASSKSLIMTPEKSALKNKYAVTTFPTLIMIEPDGKEVTRLSYSELTASKFAFSLKNIFTKFLSLQDEVAKIDLASITEDKLENLYNQAVELRCPTFISHLLDEGLKLDQGAFFCVEKYSQLVLEGKVDTEQAKALKTQIVERDQDNKEGARLRLALLDFQSHLEDPDLATKEPLSYIEDFGKKDDDNLWRLHMLISDYFSEHGREKEAKEHAEKTLETAPKEVKSLLTGRTSVEPSIKTE